MIHWQDALRQPSIQRIGEIIRRHFNLWCGFIHPSGMVAIIGAQQAVQRPLCDAFGTRSDIYGSCQNMPRTWIESIRESEALEGPVLKNCHAGLHGLLAPVLHKGELLGACYVSGFLLDSPQPIDLQVIQQRAQHLNIPKNAVRKGLKKLPRMGKRDVQLLQDLLQLMADEYARSLQVSDSPQLPLTPSKKRKSHKQWHDKYPEIIGKSPPMLRLFALLDKISQSNATVLIQGEPGTGKELVARAIHYNSRRKHKPFIVQNCSALNDNLLDSELFGHKKGAFTGSTSDKQGLFDLADQGTFFLDEIGDMSPMLQVKLLRVLQEGTFQPVGDTVIHKVDVRIIAATNRPIQKMVEEQTFRQDLYYRINVITLRLPPLRERKEDIPLLINHFLSEHAQKHQLPIKTLSNTCLQALMHYDWPGNVRELENEIERLVVLSGEATKVSETLLSPHILKTSQTQVMSNFSQEIWDQLPQQLPEALETVEKKMLLDGLRACRWNKSKAAKLLGISRRNLIRKVERYQLEHFRDS